MVEVERDDVGGLADRKARFDPQRLPAAGERTGVKIGADEGRFGSGEQRAGAMRQPLRIFERAQLARGSVKDAVAHAVELSGRPRREVYARALELAKTVGDGDGQN